MRTLLLTMFGIACILATVAVAARQSPEDDERRAAIKVLRAINTAENAARAKGGAYVPLAELLNHPMMGGVKADFAASGNGFKYAGSEVRGRYPPMRRSMS